MDFCKTVDLLYAALPLPTFRAWLIRRHMEGCPRCQARLLSREEAKKLMVGPDSAAGTDALWRRISVEACRVAPAAGLDPRGGSLVWRLAGVAGMAAIVALAGFWLLREVEGPRFLADATAPAGRFQIDYVNVDGAPAQTFVYQPQGTDTVFVWASRNP
jgi:hypothetical protein